MPLVLMIEYNMNITRIILLFFFLLLPKLDLKISFLLLSQVSLACGDVVGVIEKHENGWWLVCIEDQQGWAPSSYLEPIVKATGEEINQP